MDPKGNIINYTYDALNRLTAVSYPNSTQVSYTYDKNNNRLSMVYLSSSVYYTYNTRNWVTNETDVIAGQKYTTLYTYDQVGNVLSMTYPDTTVVSYTYDARNRIRKLVGYATFTYNTDSTISKISYGNGEVTTYTYDSRSRPKTIYTYYGLAGRLSLSYTYDAVGNVLSINSETYKYDGLNRLNYTSGGSGGWPVTTYTYDGAGNALTKTVNGVKTTYSYSSYNRLVSAGSVTFTYDGDGNTRTKVNGTTWTYSYDYENRLTKVQSGSTTAMQNTYNGDGTLIKTVEGNTQAYVYQGLNRIFTKNTGSGRAAEYYYANGLLVASVNGSTSYYHEDALGSVRLVSSSSVTALYTSNYRPYGTSWSVTGTIVSPFLYTGKPKDSVTGLYYHGARFYDPATGRFITEDSYTGTGQDPLSLNRYIYAEDNPMRFVDPNGHDIASSSGSLSSLLATIMAAIHAMMTAQAAAKAFATAAASAAAKATIQSHMLDQPPAPTFQPPVQISGQGSGGDALGLIQDSNGGVGQGSGGSYPFDPTSADYPINEQKAWALTEAGAGATGLSFFFGAVFLAVPGTQLLGVGLIAWGYYSEAGTLAAGWYTAKNGANATPEGANSEYWGGWFMQWFCDHAGCS